MRQIAWELEPEEEQILERVLGLIRDDAAAGARVRKSLGLTEVVRPRAASMDGRPEPNAPGLAVYASPAPTPTETPRQRALALVRRQLSLTGQTDEAEAARQVLDTAGNDAVRAELNKIIAASHSSAQLAEEFQHLLAEGRDSGAALSDLQRHFPEALERHALSTGPFRGEPAINTRTDAAPEDPRETMRGKVEQYMAEHKVGYRAGMDAISSAEPELAERVAAYGRG